MGIVNIVNIGILIWEIKWLKDIEILNVKIIGILIHKSAVALSLGGAFANTKYTLREIHF